ncbi:SDR family oxidoreductase [Oceanicoccus sp. KOV_DT_Chl]|uniref:SDR family oxidoreductase n=1 Tax=Oceanicoccus sp. KOV_DT_Chl TaxID=1904639 RepID=UPI000C7972F5|nr:SDR family oxidoreductase [Oceanicoccus sp. KOV_DT_Chl]
MLKKSLLKTLLWTLLLINHNALAGFNPDQPTILITGSNHGIGLEFANQYSMLGWNVIATTRKPASADALNAFAAERSNIAVEQLDVTNQSHIDALAQKYTDQPIDVLLNNAALTPKYKSAYKNLKGVDMEMAAKSLEVNAIGPLRVIQAFMPNVDASKQKKIIAISSKAGSFAEGPKMPMMYSYRASKTALNMYLYTLSFETAKKDIIVTMLSPGMVDTMDADSGMKMPKAITPAESVGSMIKVIANLTATQNGKFINYSDGAEIGM